METSRVVLAVPLHAPYLYAYVPDLLHLQSERSVVGYEGFKQTQVQGSSDAVVLERYCHAQYSLLLQYILQRR